MDSSRASAGSLTSTSNYASVGRRHNSLMDASTIASEEAPQYLGYRMCNLTGCLDTQPMGMCTSLRLLEFTSIVGCRTAHGWNLRQILRCCYRRKMRHLAVYICYSPPSLAVLPDTNTCAGPGTLFGRTAAAPAESRTAKFYAATPQWHRALYSRSPTTVRGKGYLTNHISVAHNVSVFGNLVVWFKSCCDRTQPPYSYNP